MLKKRKKTYHFTLIEMLVVVSIIAILITILMPALSKAKETARTIECQGKLRQIGLAFENYIPDWNGMLPVTNNGFFDRWNMRIADSFGYSENLITDWSQLSNFKAHFYKKRVLACDTAFAQYQNKTTIELYRTYGMNDDRDKDMNVYSVKKASQFCLVGDGYWSLTANPGWIGSHISCGLLTSTTSAWGTHNNKTRINFLYLDGHTNSLKLNEIPPTSSSGDGLAFWKGK